MNRDVHLAVLRDEAKRVVERIRAGAQLELVYWDDPNKSPPNLSRAEFVRLLNFIPSSSAAKWQPRTSTQGEYGKTGEDKVFNIEFEIIRGRKRYLYYLKGFFFEKNDLKGVCIQSFRIEKVLDRTKLRVL